MDIDQILGMAVLMGASDIHLAPKASPMARVNGVLRTISDAPLLEEEMEKVMDKVLSSERKAMLMEIGEVDLSYTNSEGRYRANFFKERQGFGAAFRVVRSEIPGFQELGLPPAMETLSLLKKGLVIVTGPTGSGKSTTLASVIDRINRTQEAHIITLEDPVEYLHEHRRCLVNQREIHKDSQGFSSALRAALRQDPDIILVGEMRDLDTISTAITAAETGHLVLSTLHTSGAARTVDRIIDVFPPHQQAQIRIQLSMVLEGIVSQQLLPRADGEGRVAAFEVMTGSTAVRNLIREGKSHQIQSQIQTGTNLGMVTMDGYIQELYDRKVITKDVALSFAHDQESMSRQISSQRTIR